MMLLTLDTGSVIHQVSDEWQALETPWLAKVVDSPSIKHATQKLHGGFAAPTFGSFTLVPGFTKERKMSALLRYTFSDEASAITLLSGTAIRKQGLADSGDKYDFRKPEYEAAYSGNLNAPLQDLFATLCGSSYLDRVLDVSGTSRNPGVSYNLSSDTPVINILSNLGAFFCHGFYDDGTTIYLYDCLEDQGSMTLSEFEFAPVTYTYATPYAQFKAGDYAINGSDPAANSDYSVSPVCHDGQSDVEPALVNIKSLMEMDGATISVRLTEKTAAIKHGMKLEWVDKRSPVPVTAWIRAQSITKNLASKPPLLVVTGKGGVA